MRSLTGGSDISQDLLTRARAVLRQRGWFQGDYYDHKNYEAKDGPCCLIGSLNVAATGDPSNTSGGSVRNDYLSAMERLARAIDSRSLSGQIEDGMLYPEANLDEVLYDSCEIVIVGWQDEEGRTREEVDNLFTRIIG